VTSGGNTTGDPFHLARTAGNLERDEHGRTLEEWADHLISTGECPPHRDVDSGVVTPAAEDVERVAAMLLANPSKLPICELGCPSTGRREQALKLLQQSLSIKYIEAERLLTASLLLHPQGKQNYINAHHLGKRIMALQEDYNGEAPSNPLLSDSNDGAAAAASGGTAHTHLSDCDPTGPRGGLSRATCGTVNTGDCSAYERELAASLARRRPTGTGSCSSDSSCFEDGEGERERELQRKREQRKQALTPGKQEGAGGTPASARLGLSPKDYQKSLNRAADELDRKVSEAVAAALKAALPQLGEDPQDGNDGNLLVVASDGRVQLLEPLGAKPKPSSLKIIPAAKPSDEPAEEGTAADGGDEPAADDAGEP
jgi:hypothetical protein